MKEAEKRPEVLSVDVYNRWWNSARTPENFKAFCREVGEYINANIAEKCGADSWQWRDEGITFAVGNFLSSCEMLESDCDFAKREDIVSEVNWLLNQSKERKVK